IVYADFHLPIQFTSGSPDWTINADAQIVHIDHEAFTPPSFDRKTCLRVLEGIQAAMRGPHGLGRSDLSTQAFSSQTVLVHSPAPIAIAFERFWMERDEPRARLERLFKALEATVKYLTLVAVSDLLHCLTVSASRAPVQLPDDRVFDFLRGPPKQKM